MCPHHVTSTEIVHEAPWPWLTGSQEEAGACGCSRSIRYHGLSPALWLLPQQHSRAVRDLLLHQTGIGAPGPFLHSCPPAGPQACGLLVLGQDFVSAVVGPCVVPVSLFPQPATVPLKSSPALQHITCLRLCIVHKLDRKGSCPRATLQLLVHRAEHLWQVCCGLFSAVFSLLTGLTSWSTWASTRTGSRSCRC